MSLESVRKRLEAAWAHPYMVAASSPGPKVCAACGRDTSERCDAAGESADLIAHAPTDLELMANVVEAVRNTTATDCDSPDLMRKWPENVCGECPGCLLAKTLNELEGAP